MTQDTLSANRKSSNAAIFFNRHKKAIKIVIVVLIAIPVLYIATYFASFILVPDPLNLEKLREAESERVLYCNVTNADSVFIVEGLEFPTKLQWLDNSKLLINDFNKNSLMLYDVLERELETLSPLSQHQIFDIEKTPAQSEPNIFICTYENLNRTKIEEYGTKLTIQKFSLTELRASKDRQKQKEQIPRNAQQESQENERNVATEQPIHQPKSEQMPQTNSKNEPIEIMIHETLMPITCNDKFIYAETSVPEIAHKYYEITLQPEKAGKTVNSTQNPGIPTTEALTQTETEKNVNNDNNPEPQIAQTSAQSEAEENDEAKDSPELNTEEAYSLKVIENVSEKYTYKVSDDNVFSVYENKGNEKTVPAFNTDQLIFFDPIQITVNEEKSAMALIENNQVFIVIKPLDWEY